MCFSGSLLNTARVGFSRAGYFFTGEPTPGTPAASLPGFLAGLPIGAVVVGGSAASNPTAQLSLAGSNNGSNLHVARNLFTYEDRVSFTKGRHQFNVGAWFQRLRSNENLALSQYGQATFTSLQTFLQGTVATSSVRSRAYSARLALLVRRVVRRRCDSAELPSLRCRSASATNLPPGGTRSMAGPPPIRSPNGDHLDSAKHRELGLHGEQRKIPAATASRPGVESFRQQAHHRDPRRVRHVQRSSGCAGLPHRSERAVQSDLQPSERRRSRNSRSRRPPRFRPPPSWFPAECSRI